MNRLPLVALLLLAPMAAEPARATLLFSADVDGVAVLRCADNQAASALCPGGDQNPAVGTLQIQNGTFGGVTLNGSVSSSVGTPANPNPNDILNTSSLNIIDADGKLHHVQAAAGDTAFAAPVGSFDASASFTAQLAQGTTVTTTFFDDALDRQGASDATSGPGAPIASFTDTVTLAADAFAHDLFGPISDLAPFSMTQLLDISLTGGQLVGRSSTEIKQPVPVAEPSSLALLGGAVITLCWLARRRPPATTG